MNIITRASVKERIHVEQIIRSQPRMHNSDLVDIVTIPVRKCLGLSMDVYKPVGEVKEPLPIILDVHGGGLIAGRKEQNRNLGIQLARRGYIVFIPDYRLVPETDIFGQISDILDALAVIEAKASGKNSLPSNILPNQGCWSSSLSHIVGKVSAVVCLLRLQKQKTFGSLLKPMEKKCRCNILFPT